MTDQEIITDIDKAVKVLELAVMAKLIRVYANRDVESAKELSKMLDDGKEKILQSKSRNIPKIMKEIERLQRMFDRVVEGKNPFESD